MAFPTPDASTPIFKASTSATPASNSFSPPSGSVIFATFVNGGDGTLASSVTDSLGSHLTWTRMATTLTDTSFGLGFEIWYAPVTTAPGSMTVHATYGTSNYVDVQVVVLTGAATTQTGNAGVVKFPGTGAMPSYGLTTTAAGSAGMMLCYQNDVTPPTPASGQTLTFGGTSSFDPTSAHNAWTQLTTAAAGALGSTITMATTAPSNGGTPPWEGIAVEILAASGAAAPTGNFFEFF